MVGTLKQTVYRQSDMNRRKRTFRRPRPAPRRQPSPHPANLDLFPYEASARPWPDWRWTTRTAIACAAIVIAAQLLYAISGVMVVETEAGIWVVPPARRVGAGLGGARHPHERRAAHAHGVCRAGRGRLPTQCCVLSISPLLRELMAAATEVPLDWQPGTRDGRLMMLLLDELRQEPVLPLHLPQPAEPRLARICRAIVRHPGGRTAWPTGPLNWGWIPRRCSACSCAIPA